MEDKTVTINAQLWQEVVVMLQTLRNLNGMYDEDKDSWKVDKINEEADQLLKQINQDQPHLTV